MRRVTATGLAGSLAALVLVISACDSASSSAGSRPSASPDPATPSTSAAPAVACATVVPAPSATPNPVGPLLTEQEAGRAWLRLVAPVNNRGASALDALANLENKKLTIKQFKAAAEPFVEAEMKLHNGIGATNWPSNVKTLTDLAFAKTGEIIGDFQLLVNASSSCIKPDIQKIFIAQTEEYGISQTIRKTLDLPTS